VASAIFREHHEFIPDEDEEYAVYNLFFQLGEQLQEAISRKDANRATAILDFAGRCLKGRLASDGEDISVAAGVSLFEHLFEDCPRADRPIMFSVLPHNTYIACRHWLHGWMSSTAFAEVDKDSNAYYFKRRGGGRRRKTPRPPPRPDGALP